MGREEGGEEEGEKKKRKKGKKGGEGGSLEFCFFSFGWEYMNGWIMFYV